jgi:hypothetical protein
MPRLAEFRRQKGSHGTGASAIHCASPQQHQWQYNGRLIVAGSQRAGPRSRGIPHAEAHREPIASRRVNGAADRSVSGA